MKHAEPAWADLMPGDSNSFGRHISRCRSSASEEEAETVTPMACRPVNELLIGLSLASVWTVRELSEHEA